MLHAVFAVLLPQFLALSPLLLHSGTRDTDSYRVPDARRARVHECGYRRKLDRDRATPCESIHTPYERDLREIRSGSA